MKALQTLLIEGKTSKDVVLLVDEMYLQKSSEYHGGRMVGKDEDGEFFSGILVFMIVGLKKSIPYVVKAVPEIKLTGDFVKQEIEECLRTMKGAGFNIRAVISDNHSTNVTAFASLQRLYGARNSGEHYIIYLEMQKVYLMYDDSVHLIICLVTNVSFFLLSSSVASETV